MAVISGQRRIADTPQNKQLDALIDVKEMVDHTYKITANEKIFFHKYDRFLNKILNTTTDILVHCVDANNIYVTDRYNYVLRMKLQEQAIRELKRMLSYISTARYLYHLRGNKAEHWSKLVEKSLKQVIKWHKADLERYKEFRVKS